jgi:citrate synthase
MLVGRTMSGADPATAGLDGVVAGRTAISWVGGETSDLVYRGFDVRELVPGVPYESVAHLLLFGEPPERDPSPTVAQALERARNSIPAAIGTEAEALDPKRPPLESLRTILSLLGDGSWGYPPLLEDGYRLIAQSPVLFARHVRRSKGLSPVEPKPELGHVANYLWMLEGREPEPRRTRAMEAYFDLLADHGMNASTFVLRIAISTNSDLASAATAALGTLKGPLHGGAPSRVLEMLDAIGRPERAEAWLRERLARKQVVYGFGHRAYKSEDPRGLLLHEVARSVARPSRLALAESVEQAALALLRAAHPKARIFANVEFYSAVVLEATGLPPELFTPTFGLARTVGWTAHALEQAADNRLIRPDIEYVGPPKGRRWPRPLAAA